MSEIIITEYTDPRGLRHKVQLSDTNQHPELGIHIDVNLEDYLTPYGFKSDDIVAIQAVLWQNEIIYSKDYFGACYDKVVSAFRTRMPAQEAKKYGNALISDVREVVNSANRNNRQYYNQAGGN